MPIVGDVLADRYRIESILGVGGMASVYRATDLRLDRQVAVKVLVANLAADPQFAERFNREAGAMAGFSHPNVAAVYDVEPGDPATGREPFYVMEFCRDGSLADRLRIGGPMAPAELIPIVAAVSEGLAELHRHGLIHRDVKPSNILFAGDRPKLADFGVAWSEGPRDGEPLTLPGSMPGTAAYLAPELAAGEPPSAASDVYALGVTIFQSLTGQYPQPSTIDGASPDVAPVTFLPVSAAAPGLGLRFDAPLADALDPDPAVRPSPAELAAQLTDRLGTWGVAQPNPGAVAALAPVPGAPSGVDMDAPTRVATERPPAAAPGTAAPQPPAPQPVAPQRPAPQPPAPQPRAPAAKRPAAYATWVVVLAILAILAVVALPGLLGGDRGVPGGSPVASADTSATAQATAAATAQATEVPRANEAVFTALDQVDAAIQAARGGKDGLKGRAENELAELAAAVRRATDQGDLDAAAATAQELSDRSRALTTSLDGPRRDSLLAAIDGLVAALPPS